MEIDLYLNSGEINTNNKETCFDSAKSNGKLTQTTANPNYCILQ